MAEDDRYDDELHDDELHDEDLLDEHEADEYDLSDEYGDDDDGMAGLETDVVGKESLGEQAGDFVRSYGLYMLLSLAFLLPAGYHLWGLIRGPEVATVAAVKSVSKAVPVDNSVAASAKKATEKSPQLAPHSGSASVVSATASDASLKKFLAKLPDDHKAEEERKALDLRLTKLEKQLKQMNTTLAAMHEQAQKNKIEPIVRANTRELVKASRAILFLTRNIQQLNGKVKDVSVRLAGQYDADDPSVVSHQFRLQAVIPGRAWYKNQKGEVHTVVVGDTIAPLGRVVNIDPEAGVVVTSKGKVIKQVLQGG